MNAKASNLAITLVLLLLSAGICQGTHTYPKIANNFTSSARLEYCETLSKWDIVILHRKVRENTPEILSSMRNLNPDIEILTYFPCAAVWAAYDSMDAPAYTFGAKVEACDWYLYDDKGNRVGDPNDCWFVNLSIKCPESSSGETVHEWLAEHMANEVILGGSWDGILLDILFDDPWWINVRDFFQEPPAMIDIDRDGLAEGPDSAHAWWKAGVVRFLDELRERVGSSSILVGNGKHCLSDQLNGGIREDFPYMHGGWEENMLSDYGYLTQCMEMTNYEVTCPMLFCFWRHDENTLYEPKRTASYERHLRYTLCSALLGDGYYLLYGGSYNLWWEPYYDLNLGAPTGDARLDSLWNQMYHRYSPVWRRDFENATVYCNPFEEFISFEGGWLSPQDGLIKTYDVPASVSIDISPGSLSARTFDRNDRYLTYKVIITNPTDNAVFASVWADLSNSDTTFVSGRQIEYLVGAQDTAVENRVLRLPPSLSPGTYCLEAMVGGPNFAEIDRDTVMLSKLIEFEEKEFKHEDGGSAGHVTVYPQPSISTGGHLSVEVDPGSSSGRICSITLYDVGGRVISRALGEKVGGVLSLDIDLSSDQGRPLAPGVYFLSVDLEDRKLTKKVILLRR